MSKSHLKLKTISSLIESMPNLREFSFHEARNPLRYHVEWNVAGVVDVLERHTATKLEKLSLTFDSTCCAIWEKTRHISNLRSFERLETLEIIADLFINMGPPRIRTLPEIEESREKERGRHTAYLQRVFAATAKTKHGIPRLVDVLPKSLRSLRMSFMNSVRATCDKLFVDFQGNRSAYLPQLKRIEFAFQPYLLPPGVASTLQKCDIDVAFVGNDADLGMAEHTKVWKEVVSDHVIAPAGSSE